MHNFERKDTEALRKKLTEVLKEKCGIFSYMSASRFVEAIEDRILDPSLPVIRGKFGPDPKLVGFGYKKERSRFTIENEEFDFGFLTDAEQAVIPEYKTVSSSDIEGSGDGGDAIGDVLVDLEIEYKDKDIYFKKKEGINC
jgi:hypothetical protein